MTIPIIEGFLESIETPTENIPLYNVTCGGFVCQSFLSLCDQIVTVLKWVIGTTTIMTMLVI